MVGEADQSVALRVAAGEQRPARRRAQRRGGVCSGEQDALTGQPVEPRAGNVGVTVDTEIPAQIVPMHEQHIVTALFYCLVVADYRHLLSWLSPIDVIGNDVSRVTAPSTSDARTASDSPMWRVAAGARRALLRGGGVGGLAFPPPRGTAPGG